MMMNSKPSKQWVRAESTDHMECQEYLKLLWELSIINSTEGIYLETAWHVYLPYSLTILEAESLGVTLLLRGMSLVPRIESHD